jgi:hypothetical protein
MADEYSRNPMVFPKKPTSRTRTVGKVVMYNPGSYRWESSPIKVHLGPRKTA